MLVLYVDDILLACSDKDMLHETKNFLSSNFDMKDLGEASYILGIEIGLKVCWDYHKRHTLSEY